MESRQRVLNVLERKPIDRIPVDLWYTPEIGLMLRAYLGAMNDCDLYRMLEIDKLVWIDAVYPVESGRTVWGSKLRQIDAGDAIYTEIELPGLKAYDTPEALADYPFWPNPNNFDYDLMAKRARTASQHYSTLGPWISLFEVYCQLRGLEQSMMDLVMAPDYVHAVLDKIESCQSAMIRRFFETASRYIDLVFISDDMGSQNNLMFSLEMWDVFFKERMKRWCDLIHSYGIKVFFHSDGAMEPLISRLIEAGVDVLNPIQHICSGMEMPALKEKYGNQLIFHGGVENQSVLPFGTPNQVRQETLNCLETLGNGMQGYICCSCHNIQPGTPVENIIEMIDTVKEYR